MGLFYNTRMFLLQLGRAKPFSASYPPVGRLGINKELGEHSWAGWSQLTKGKFQAIWHHAQQELRWVKVVGQTASVWGLAGLVVSDCLGFIAKFVFDSVPCPTAWRIQWVPLWCSAALCGFKPRHSDTLKVFHNFSSFYPLPCCLLFGLVWFYFLSFSMVT